MEWYKKYKSTIFKPWYICMSINKNKSNMSIKEVNYESPNFCVVQIQPSITCLVSSEVGSDETQSYDEEIF